MCAPPSPIGAGRAASVDTQTSRLRLCLHTPPSMLSLHSSLHLGWPHPISSHRSHTRKTRPTHKCWASEYYTAHTEGTSPSSRGPSTSNQLLNV